MWGWHEILVEGGLKGECLLGDYGWAWHLCDVCILFEGYRSASLLT